MLSVIIPTCNRNDLLRQCLAQLQPHIQQISLNEYEVIVTDDSKDGAAKLLIEREYTWAKWVEGPKKGPAANRNNGAKHTGGDWLVFIDDDCIPDADIIKTYDFAISNYTNVLAFEGRIYVNEPQTSFFQEAPLNDSGGFFWSCNICVKKNIFSSLNGFDERFPFAAMEDVDFFKRLKAVTDSYLFLHGAAVLHPWRNNKQLFRTTLKRYKSQQYFLSKHPEERKTINGRYYFHAFANQMLFTLKNSWRFRFSGFIKKCYCNFLQLYFAIRSVIAAKPKINNDV